jgi:hypothetical protein
MAGRTSLAILGQEDVFLSSDPEVTYFVEKYAKKTNWTSRIDEVYYGPQNQYFGGETFVELPRSGDIISKIYIKIQNPGVFSNLLDSAGTLMIQFVDLYIGAQLVDRQWGEYIEMKQDLEVPQTKQGALAKLTGKNLTPYLTNGGLATYTIDVPFFMLKRGIPICAIKDPIIVRIGFSSVNTFSIGAPQAPAFDSSLYVEYVYLDDPEREHIKKTPLLYLNEHVQREQFFVPRGITTAKCKTQFANPVKEVFFVLQADTALGYDYGTTDTLVNMSMEFNGVTHFGDTIGTPGFLRIIQPLEFHTRKPDRIFYMYSFSFDPQSDVPTGHLNFSLINNQNFNFKIVNNLHTGTYIRIYALAYNFVRIERGNTEVMFSNYES